VTSVQRAVLRGKLLAAAESDFGRRHGFRSVRSVVDFRRQVPITDFEYYRPYVERVKQGETTAMFGPRQRVRMFALTSGTTARPKSIPVTDTFLREYTRGWRIWGLQAHRDHLPLLGQSYVHLASDWQETRTAAGIWCGNISGLAAETRPAIIRSAFLIPPIVSKIPDWDARQYVALRLSLAVGNVGMVITANPMTLIGLARLADQRSESLLRDLYDGTLAGDVEIPTPIRQRLARRLGQRHRTRCRQLEQIVTRMGRLAPREFWPQLSLIAVWTGGSAATFLPQVEQYYGPCPLRDHGLSASEGRMTIPLHDGTSAGVLDFLSSYFEFIPAEEHGSNHPTVLEAHQLQSGQSYYILLTTSSGLYRYDIQDVVRCVGFQGTAPVLEFLHKGAHCSNVTGEKLTEFQVATAVRLGFRELGWPAEHVMLAPVLGTQPGYELLIETRPDRCSVRLARCIDDHLSRMNCEYANRLATGRLRPLVARELPRGTWTSHRERKLAQHGGSPEQYKHTFLSSLPDLDLPGGSKPIPRTVGEP
jgi:hypothetical protein